MSDYYEMSDYEMLDKLSDLEEKIIKDKDNLEPYYYEMQMSNIKMSKSFYIDEIWKSKTNINWDEYAPDN